MISIASPDQFPSLAALFANANQTAVSQCLISGQEATAIATEMKTSAAAGEFLAVLSGTTQQPVASMAADFDLELGRAWLWGPVGDARRWPALWQTLQDALPPAVQQFDSFLNVQNQAGLQFYLAQGFVTRNIQHVYVAQPSSVQPAQPPAQPFNGRFANQLITLHDALFPNTYVPGAAMVNSQDNSHRTFILSSQSQLLGYVYATLDESDNSGMINFLGVAEAARGQGTGRRLLQTAVSWLIQQHNVSHIYLVVGEQNNSAQALYLSAGFKHKYAGQSLQYQPNPPAHLPM